MNIKKKFKSFTIRSKLFLILSALLLLVSFLSLFILQISFKIYDKQILNSSSEVLSLYSTNIENELGKIDRMTFDILSDNKIQEYLKIINTKQSSYEKVNAYEEMRSVLQTSSNLESYITAVTYIDIYGNEYTAENDTIKVLEEKSKMEILYRAKEKEGNIVWIEPLENEKCIFAARLIRSKYNLESLATLVVRIDKDKLISLMNRAFPWYKTELLILSEDNRIIYKDERINLDNVNPILAHNKNYELKNIGNKKFLVNMATTSYTKWRYIYFLSYENIFQGLIKMRISLILSFGIIFVIVLLIGVKFTNGITKPIISLSKKMKRVENGDFEITDIEKIPDDSCDEVQQLNKDFGIMVEKVNALIKDNYIKQILVKETELKTLQAQINPHFLYNTLESINFLAKINKQAKISTMVKSLGNLLRNSINNRDIIIKVEDEINLLNNYIAIQKIRFEERLDFSMNIKDEFEKYSIPKLTLQPIVENSINYGLENITGICKILVEANIEDDTLVINIIDNGPGMSKELIEHLERGEIKSKGLGVGLKNINERIKLTFGDRYGLSFYSEINQGTTVKIKIPCVYEVK